jgi:hypothetical protein
VRLRNTLDVMLQAIDILEYQIFDNISRHQADILLQAPVAISGRAILKRQPSVLNWAESAQRKP